MNMYINLGNHVGTLEARELAEQLVVWHDAMVKHLRVSDPPRGSKCHDECPHKQAALLWSAASDIFGARAGELVFLRSHAQAGGPRTRDLREQVRDETRL